MNACPDKSWSPRKKNALLSESAGMPVDGRIAAEANVPAVSLLLLVCCWPVVSVKQADGLPAC